MGEPRLQLLRTLQTLQKPRLEVLAVRLRCPLRRQHKAQALQQQQQQS